MDKLIQGLHQFQTNYFSSHKALFEELAHGQKPRILFITCSDSRIDPNLITQAGVGELFVIRNAGNIIPPYGATNGGEGAALEYALQALNIQNIIVCGHSHCGAMKGLLKLDKLKEEMPMVYDWLQWAEATRRTVKDNYIDYEGLDLLEIMIAENVLSQLENLHTYPVVRSKLHQGKLSIHGWIYRIESGEVLSYDPELHDFTYPSSRISFTEPEYQLHPNCLISKQKRNFTVQSNSSASQSKHNNSNSNYNNNSSHLPGYERLSQEQAQRIYRGSYS